MRLRCAATTGLVGFRPALLVALVPWYFPHLSEANVTTAQRWKSFTTSSLSGFVPTRCHGTGKGGISSLDRTFYRYSSVRSRSGGGSSGDDDDEEALYRN
eukprot:5535479-Ditylum_brightwellii.AAC.1